MAHLDRSFSASESWWRLEAALEEVEDDTGDEVEAVVLEDGGATVLAPTLLLLGLGRGAAV